jgi:hypothetical protein
VPPAGAWSSPWLPTMAPAAARTGRPGARSGTKARWGCVSARQAADGALRRPVPSLPPCSQEAPAYGIAGRYATARRRTARGAGALGRAASGHAASGGSTSGRVLAVRRGAPAHDVAVRRRPVGKILECPCLNVSNSKKLNRSAPNNEYESCRSRRSSVFLDGLVFCKGRLVFFSTDFAGTSCQL